MKMLTARRLWEVVRSHLLFSLLVTLALFSVGKVPTTLAVGVLWLEVFAVIGYGVWLGIRMPHLPARGYLVLGLGLGIAMWLAQAAWGSRRFPDYDVQLLFWRVVTAVTLLATGGAMLGDFIARRRMTLSSPVAALCVSAAGVVVSGLQLIVS